MVRQQSEGHRHFDFGQMLANINQEEIASEDNIVGSQQFSGQLKAILKTISLQQKQIENL